MSIFEFTDYRKYIKSYVKSLSQSRGELSRIAQVLSINTTLLSQILAGTRDFNFDQTHQLSQYLGHSEIETEYMSLLVQIERAGTAVYKKHLIEKLNHLKNESLKLNTRIVHERKLKPEERSEFYSSWLYSAIHLYTSIDERGLDLDTISARFSITKRRAKEILNFLVRAGLCVEKDGKFRIQVQSTFLPQGSPDLLKHHSNWRLKAIQKSEHLTEQDFMFTGQVSISKKDFVTVREKLSEFLKETSKLVKDSKSEELACLNIDWFWMD